MKNNLIRLRLIFFSITLLSAGIMLNSCSNESQDEIEQEIIEENDEEEEKKDVCPNGKLFIEKDGLVRIDIENPSDTPNGWTETKTLAGFKGSEYLVWTGADNFNSPGQGVMKFSVKISTLGTYQFVWNSRITTGNSNTEHNDSWLRIQGDNFFGEKLITGQRVYPKGSGKTPNPQGSSKDGWLKVYMNRLNEWFWRSSTNDNDLFDVFVTFDKAGTYDVEISGRSRSHGIDQFVLFKTDKSLEQAKNANFSEIECK
ncbi:hypothetical protein [Hyunsoonleella pacifica]|uniref:Uncharacterized protein n=1 Tax=Hyunsoonleella pacifica TaxID=1080224 RepID=A0A4Q9FMM8_9FLAO|nr:hypothetical protein [Hyunsoonleella pacifica]TBN13077.1 hypothetical protein EYD46_16380 [Hyunsoonleella pacifica]GGD27313.1 hypothetical protein GCM10011368_31690 [Hyunsoonleella pacifica]